MMRIPVRSKRRGRAAIVQPFTLPAPHMGLNTRDPLDQMKSAHASFLQNWWPNGVRVTSRPGVVQHLTDVGEAVKTLAVWEGVSGSPEMYALTDNGIFDATAAGVAGTSVQAYTQGFARHLQFRNSAGAFLVMVNGTDDYTYYNGTTWTTVATFAKDGGGTLDTNTLVGVMAHKRRLWFVEAGTSDAWHLDTDAITGTCYRFVLGPLFTEGGFLVAASTWSLDAGNGPDDYAVFLSSKGQAAVYAGTDPTDPTAWSLVGVYKLADPLGYRCMTKVAGDLFVLTSAGIFSMLAVSRGSDQSSSPSYTDIIGPTFNGAARAYRDQLGWQMEVYPEENMLLVNVPTSTAETSYQFAQNLITGAWTVFTDWNASCWAVLGKELFFGGVDGVENAWSGFDDFGSPITCKARTAYSNFGGTGLQKQWRLCRPNLVFKGTVTLGVGLDVDYAAGVAYDLAGEATAPSDIWDTGVWDTAVWGGLEPQKADWISLAAWPGYAAAFRLRTLTINGRVSWTQTKFLFESGAMF